MRGKLVSETRTRDLPSLTFILRFIGERIDNTDARDTLAQISAIIQKANKLSEEAKDDVFDTATEKVIDVTVLKLGHDIVNTVARFMGEREFDGAAYARAIGQRFGSDEWDDVFKRIYEIPKVTFWKQSMLGTYVHDEVREAPQKAQKERVVRQKAKLTEMKRPDKVENLKREEKGAQLVSMIREKLAALYEERGPLDYLELIIDPDDYMATVDNAFQVSFLIRDGFLGATITPNRKIKIHVISPRQQKAKEEDSKTIQAVMSLSVNKWKRACQIRRNARPLIDINRREFWRDVDGDESLTQQQQQSQQSQSQSQRSQRLTQKPSVKTRLSQMQL